MSGKEHEMKNTKRQSERQTPTTNDAKRLQRPDIAALAGYYWSPPESNLLREDLLERSRLALAKYDLEQEQLEETAPLLASALHMLIEQNGGKPLPAEYAREVEHQVLHWCGCDSGDRSREEAEVRREYRARGSQLTPTANTRHVFPKPSRGRPTAG